MTEPRFFVGLHQPSDAKHFEDAFISVHRLKGRKSDFVVRNWIIDCGGFSTISLHGGYPDPVEDYASQVNRWKNCGNMLAAVSQDYMCEPHMLAITGLTIADHQRLTIERYDALKELVRDVYIMPVLQGYAPEDYVSHIRQYGSRLKPMAWVGVGSVCKRNGDPRAIENVLLAIKEERPDLRLHGFRVEADSSHIGYRSGTPVYVRLDGVELPGEEARPQRKRLAGGDGVQPQYRRNGVPAEPVPSMTASVAGASA